MTNYDEMFERGEYAKPKFNEKLINQLSDRVRAENLGCAFDDEMEAIDERIAELEYTLTQLGAKERDVIRAEEREACAKVCDAEAYDWGNRRCTLQHAGWKAAEHCAAVIRARNK